MLYEKIVAIDLETTGVDPYRDHIIEIGAVVYGEGVIEATFSELIYSPSPLPLSIRRLTGIQPDDLSHARDRNTVLADFLEFLPDEALCIAHNATFERNFLRVATQDRFRHIVLDTVGLARICYPELPSHSLEWLREALHLDHNGSHRALDDCLALIELWKKLIERAFEIPLPVIREMNRLLAARPEHPYRDFFQRVEAELLTRHFGENERLESIFRQRGEEVTERVPPDEKEEWIRLDPDRVAEIFEEGGALSQALPDYEPRPQQQKMARAVTEALNHESHLLAEAGTGIGKSLAYLVPSVLWAIENEVPVVISTNTKNLQSQLYEKDLPLLRHALNLDFKAALIKGRANYLCLRKLFYLLHQADWELDPEERILMLTILSWAARTETGDISENILSGRPGFSAFWAKLATISDECMGKECRYQSQCFLRKARHQALAADIIIANHALVFSELNMPNSTLPPYAHIVFDEAHNLEEAATSHLSVEISRQRIGLALRRLRHPGKKGPVGLLPSIRAELASPSCRLAPERRDRAIAYVESAEAALDALIPRIDALFGAIHTLLESSRKEESLRFQADRKLPSQWSAIEEAKKDLIAGLATLLRAVEALGEILDEEESGSIPHQREFVRDLEAQTSWLEELQDDLAFVLDGSNPEYVYWIEPASNKEGSVRVWAAPCIVGPLLHDQVYAQKRSVIFSSATLSVRHSFAYMKHRLGIDLIDSHRLTEIDLGTPFDYTKQCVVLAPTFLPEPNERRRNFGEDFTDLLADIVRRSEGRTLVLFTSYEMLTEVAKGLEKRLVDDGITVLSQGISGSRESITAIFKRGHRSVLLGTHSFWEGVDIIGEALSCLVIARLPFHVYTEPIHEARSERVEAEGESSFFGYTLPAAVIRFRQGFGRLIRHRNDRGVVIVADRRYAAMRYGSWFRESIPARTETYADRKQFLDRIEEFLS